ncbi:P-loop containing nucleoside triphosphate hydrolase protein [Kickxella alabastrina]|uniref:P-loop containing nucleoside triphosphate hydrolase protein n=1 Tax=Kickxella alabastrina TaxID=61397 RepID=UPI00221FB9F2|nr:P-loop containing nucleoside triphosphate hydrolase protein [Kickxella alabastrina]KAI7834872.1 P-loop containing nucleoside triphosphate hydrolase protein [Kickxella alabastrina]
MAEDDGLMFNFDTSGVSTPVVTVRSKPKGGGWKDRLHQRRVMQFEAKKAQTPTQEGMGARKSENPVEKEQQNKEVQKLLGEIKGGSAVTKSKTATVNAQLSHQANKQIISSLFTKNPEIPSMPRNLQQEHNVASNSVVDTSSFTGIGLDSDIVEFLKNKMDITKPTAIQQNSVPVLIGKELPKANVSAANDDDDDTFNIDAEVKVEHDVFIQAATGSGKTLAYLLPIFHRLLQATATATSGAPPSRELGTFAVILTPTRELAQQVYETAQSLVHMPLSRGSGKKLHWMVPGIVIGGDSKSSEKARLRKGVTILACTPGRLLDHLENTKSFCVDNLRWLVLDEADRLLELGFQETLSKILALFEERAKRRGRVLGHTSMATSLELPRRRINVLCSATLRDNVRKLADEALVNPKYVSATSVYESADQAAADARSRKRNRMLTENYEEGALGKKIRHLDSDEEMEGEEGNADDDEENFSVPSQLVQKAIIVPAKLRLVTLVAQLKNTFRKQPTSKMIVFLSCKDAVDFMYFLLSHGAMEPEADFAGSKSSKYAEDLFKNIDATAGQDEDEESGSKSEGRKKYVAPERTGPTLKDEDIFLESTVFPGAKLYRLHGSMPQKRRTESFLAFSKSQHASILFTTDVSARGLDLPNVTSIIQFDPPSDLASYLHRVGRTARLGRVGEAVLFLLPSESAYLTLLQEKGLRPDDESMEAVLKLMAKSEGNVRKGTEWQLRAGEIQVMLERFVMTNMTASRLAKQAYLSSIRAYATHISAERHIFHVRFLHFGHCAKAFALRETPNQVALGKGNNQKAVGVKKDKKEKQEMELAIKKKPKFKKGNDISEFAVGDISAYYGPRVKHSNDDNE